MGTIKRYGRLAQATVEPVTRVRRVVSGVVAIAVAVVSAIAVSPLASLVVVLAMLFALAVAVGLRAASELETHEETIGLRRCRATFDWLLTQWEAQRIDSRLPTDPTMQRWVETWQRAWPESRATLIGTGRPVPAFYDEPDLADFDNLQRAKAPALLRAALTALDHEITEASQ